MLSVIILFHDPVVVRYLLCVKPTFVYTFMSTSLPFLFAHGIIPESFFFRFYIQEWIAGLDYLHWVSQLSNFFLIVLDVYISLESLSLPTFQNQKIQVSLPHIPITTVEIDTQYFCVSEVWK